MASARALPGPGSDPTAADLQRHLMAHLPGMAYRCRHDEHWTIEYVSPGCRQVTGFAPQDLVGNKLVSYGALVHPADARRVRSIITAAIRAGEPFQLTYRIRRADGAVREVWEQGRAVLNRDGSVEALVGFVTDITKRDALPRRVDENEEYFRVLVERSLAGVYILNANGFEYVNPKFAAIFGYEVEELLDRRSMLDLAHPDDRALVAAKVRRRLAGNEYDPHYEFRGVTKTGEEIELSVYSARVPLGVEPVCLGTLLDVTEARRARRRYHLASKMEALGRLSGGVAHDFKNILSVIHSTAELLQVGNDPAEQREDLEAILAAVQQGTELCRQLMRFGRGEDAEDGSAHCYLQRVVKDTQGVLRRVVGPKIDLSVHVDEGLGPVGLACSRVEEVLMNLVTNARDAMPEGGRVDIELRRAGPNDLPSGLAAGSYAMLRVTDQGKGIQPEIQRRLFEPYFTTKGDDGTGLGLANVWRIADDAGGTVTVESSVGLGSTFSVYLPVASHGSSASSA